MTLLFWSAAIVLVYTYIFFPLLIILRGLVLRRTYHSAASTPPVSLIIAAHNEAQNIGTKLDNILALDYPRDCLEVIIASDGSNDDTELIVKGYESQRVKLIALPRVGKAPALNAAVAASTGDILVFSDANSMYAATAIRALVAPFADPAVGGVAGNQCYTKQHANNLTGAGERSYWDFDRLLKQFQSQAGNTISATGAIYAIRRSLFKTVPTGVTDDFVTSTQVIAQGYRLVFAPEAKAYEPVAASGGAEFGRKVRVITRGLRAVLVMRDLLNPFKYGFYAVQLFSHKVLRRLAVFPLIQLFLASPFLWQKGPLYQLVLIGQCGLYGLGGLGYILKDTHVGRFKIFNLPFFFCMVYAASLVAAVNILRGHRIELWQPQREAGREQSSVVAVAPPLSLPRRQS